MTDQHNFTKPPHVLLFSFPAQGHVNPMIQFAKRLLSKGVKSTLITTTFFFNSTHPHNNTSIQIEHISDGFDDGGLASADSPETYVKTFKEVGSRSLADLINKLLQSDQGSTTIDAMICDSVVPWFLDVAEEFGISGGLFFTQACAVSSIYYHVYKGLISLPPGGNKVSVPGFAEVEWWEMPSFVHSPGAYPAWGEMMFDQFSNIDRATWVFSSSFYQLEKQVIEWMRTMWNMKVIGPTLPSMYLDKCLKDDQDYSFNLWKPNNTECMNWLNQKSKKSVVYVSFGSVAQLSPEQTKEIAWALIDSGMNFLWVVRAEEEAKLPQNFVQTKSEKGLIVSWCKQLDVLAHESVGCFVTHCGFNSTLEAVSLGVPIVGMPQWTDQTTNAKCLEDIWGVGVRVKADENGIVTRGNILSCIKMIMDEENGSVARMNAQKWMDFAKEAVDEGGSSDKDIDEFVCELKHRC